MMTKNQSTQAPLPTVWQSISAGFDTVTKNYWLLLLPVALDFFLWLGPRLSFTSLLKAQITQMAADPVFSQYMGPITADAITPTNLWGMLSVPLLGVPTLMSAVVPEVTPLPAATVEVQSAWTVIGLFLLFSVLGLLLAAFYWNTLAQAVKGHSPWFVLLGRAAAKTPVLWLQLLVLIVLFLMLAFIIYLVTLPILVILGLFSPALVVVGAVVQVMLLIWVVLYWFFAPHGLTLNGRSLLRSIVESLYLVQTFMLPTLSLFLVIVFVRQLMDSVMLLADDGSWLTAVSLIAHAFVSTALLLATFIFYRDRHTLIFQKPTEPPAKHI
jgi:hypothetical protein